MMSKESNIELPKGIMDIAKDSRDTQFAGFAKLLMKEADGQVGEVTEWAAERDIDDVAKIDQELSLRWKTLFTRRAYDLVVHAVGHTLEYLHECGHPTRISDVRIIASIPDLDNWSKWGYKDEQI